MSGKALFIDTTLCMGCRGCQIACKQWNQLPATKTENWGNYQNPRDLSFSTYKLVRFQEHPGRDKKPMWYFFSDQCRHCLQPPCKDMADAIAPGGVTIDRFSGAVLYNDKLRKIDSEDIRYACPFDVPRADADTGSMAKCTMCVDRVQNGLLPACVKTCPTGALNFGDRDAMIALAENRKKEVESKFPKTELTGLADQRVFYLFIDDPARYYQYAAVKTAPMSIDRKLALKKIGNSLKDLSRELFFFNRV